MEKEMIDSILEKRVGAGRDQLIAVLQDVQESYGYLSKENINKISDFFGVASSKVYGVATFYNQFRFQPKGKYEIQVCRGTACHVQGSLKVLQTLQEVLEVEAGQTTKDGLFTLEVVACIGACGLAPVISINGEFFAKLTPDSVKDVIKTFREKEQANVQ